MTRNDYLTNTRTCSLCAYRNKTSDRCERAMGPRYSQKVEWSETCRAWAQERSAKSYKREFAHG